MTNKDKILAAAEAAIEAVDKMSTAELDAALEECQDGPLSTVINPISFLRSIRTIGGERIEEVADDDDGTTTDDAFLSDVGVGDYVITECFTSMGTGGKSKVTEIKVKYDEDTGEGYNVICCGTHHFDGRDGVAMNAPTMYYIAERVPTT